MLQALSDDNKLVTLATLPRKKIEHIRKHQQFYCPTCSEQVIIKAGSHVVPHFAHRANSQCDSIHQGEGLYHMKGKVVLKEWLKAQQIPVKLEPFIQKINQTPDLLIQINKRQVAIEFQCSRTPIEAIQKRNSGYKRAGIIPIWILGNNLLKRKSNQLHISPFTLQFIHKFKETTPTSLFYFCPDKRQFSIVTNIFLTSSNRAFHQCHIKRMNTMTFNQLFTNRKIQNNQLFNLWKKEVQRFRLQRRYQAKGAELEWRTWLYHKGIAIDHLPIYIHLPTDLQFFMKVPPWNWQSRLCLDIIHPLEVGKLFTIHTCKRKLENFIYPQHYYPLINKQSSPIKQYLARLERLNIIKQHTTHQYYKQQEIKFNKTIEEALKADDVHIKQLMYNYS